MIQSPAPNDEVVDAGVLGPLGFTVFGDCVLLSFVFKKQVVKKMYYHQDFSFNQLVLFNYFLMLSPLELCDRSGLTTDISQESEGT